MYPRSSSSHRSLRYRSQKCLNCGTLIDRSDRYCSYCGQLNSTKRLSLYDYFSVFLTSVITYDSRIIYTIRDLITRPGTISRNYIKGKRMRYANPFRFFLSVSIIFFLLSGFLDFIIPETDQYEIDDSTQDNNTDLGDGISDIFNENETASNDYLSEDELNSLSFTKMHLRKISQFRDFYKTTGIKSPKRALDSLNFKHSRYNLWLYNRNEALDQINDHPSEFLRYVISKTPFILFFLAPFFAFIFLLLYFRWYSYRTILNYLKRRQDTLWYCSQKHLGLSTVLLYLHAFLLWPFRVKRKINYMEHLIFIFHIFTFVFLMLLFCLIPDIIFSGEYFRTIVLILTPFYIYKALRNFYRQNRFFTLLNFLILNIVFLVLGGISTAFFFILTAATY